MKKNKKSILIVLLIAIVVVGVIVISSLLGGNASNNSVVDSDGKVKTGSNASYSVAREQLDKQIVDDFIESLESDEEIDMSKLDPEQGYNFEDDIMEGEGDDISPLDDEGVVNNNDNSNLYCTDETSSRQYWVTWEQNNVEDMYYYKDTFMDDMIIGLLSGNIKSCPMITAGVQDTYANGILPQNKSVEVVSVDTNSCTAVASVIFMDDTVKNYNISYSLNSDDEVNNFTVVEGK